MCETDDGAQYFDENKADKFSGSGGALVVSATVLRGVTALAGVLPDGIKVDICCSTNADTSS